MQNEASPLYIVGIAGSLRKASYNRALLAAARQRAPTGVQIEIHTLDPIPLYNQDIENQGIPTAVQKLRDAIYAADAVLLVTPEYNSGIPGVLKNTLDWLSRPPKPHPFDGRPVGIMGTTPGGFGTRAAQYQLRQVLVPLNAYVMAQPMMLVPGAGDKFDEEQTLTDEKTLAFLDRYLTSFSAWTRHFPA
ncbi:MAG: NAD(P)H-dependent oxidoreductase [Thermoanaerobaculia bacterium]|nr:NAD(P)H-dependent oxidoreductase [Thermoanaerobaculia bacterium]